MHIWKKYFGPLSTIVGIDIDPACAALEDDLCKVRIGSQSDYNFLTGLIDEFGNPDIIIDDGSHMQNDMLASFSHLFPKLNNDGVYLVEDVHTCYWDKYSGGVKKPGTFIENAKDMVDVLNAWHHTAPDKISWMTNNLWKITFYDSVIVFDKKKRGRPFPNKTPR